MHLATNGRTFEAGLGSGGFYATEGNAWAVKELIAYRQREAAATKLRLEGHRLS